MYSFLKAFLVLMKLLSLSQFYAPKYIVTVFALTLNHRILLSQKLLESNVVALFPAAK